jgi:hypothetical protein
MVRNAVSNPRPVVIEYVFTKDTSRIEKNEADYPNDQTCSHTFNGLRHGLCRSSVSGSIPIA